MLSFARLKDFFIGKPLSSETLEEARLPKLKALPILSSDALSSVAYGTEAILRVLVLGGAVAFTFALPVSIAICILIGILGASYWQTIEAYPNGGGAFTVARENLGTAPSLIAASALLLDYLLTVAVSVTAGVLALVSAFPLLFPHTVAIALFVIAVIAIINLRGVRESAGIFAFPTYLFIFFVGLLFLMLMWKLFQHQLKPFPLPRRLVHRRDLEVVSVVMLLRAFAMGCTALTGIECIANSVSVFKRPEVVNAQKTLLMMVILLGSMFLGIGYFSDYLHLIPREDESLLSILGRAGFGDGFLYYALQGSTALILLLAANTAFTGFPRLASILSEHGYLPKQLNSLGDRLSFSNGIILLAILSGLLVILFHGNTYALLPLYSIGVFLAFSLSQLGMVVCWYRLRTPRWQVKFAINLLGCITTSLALFVIIESKFAEGAWVMLVLIPCFVFIFIKIHRHYQEVQQEISVTPEQVNHFFYKAKDVLPKVVIPISKIHRGTLAAIHFAQRISTDVTAVMVEAEEEKNHSIREQWDLLPLKIPLVILESPYRSTINPLVEYILNQDRREPERGLSVIVMPKAITARWWHALLHNHRATLFKTALYANKGHHSGSTRIFVDVPYQLKL